MNIFSYELKLIILGFIEPEYTDILRLTNKAWNQMPKQDLKHTNFLHKYQEMAKEVVSMCKLGALADNLDLPCDISFENLSKFYDMYMHIPKNIRLKYKPHDIVFYYKTNGNNLNFHKQLKHM